MMDEVENDISVADGASQGDNGSVSPNSFQWGVTESPLQEEGKEVKDKDVSDSMEGEAEVQTAAVAETVVVDKKTSNDSPSKAVTKARFERKYNCDICSFQTVKSKEYLFHMRDIHGEKLNIFECHLCDYASRYNNKLSRHMSVHKKTLDLELGVGPLRDRRRDSGVESPQAQELRVKPLKLRRLHVKAPSVFQVSHDSKPKNESQESPPLGKEVFKMVLTADGSHHYQCRGCLFYASNTAAVKKHHSLCHNKLLQCAHCPFTTTSQAEHYEHLVTHEAEGKSFMKCEDCSYATNSRTNYENHRNFHGSGLPFTCRVCNFAADSECKVKRHMATQHTNQSALKDMAETSGDVMMSDSWGGENLEESMYEDLEEVAQNTVECNKSPKISDPKKKHLMKYKCQHCSVICLRRANLTRHLIARHNYSQADASVSSMNLERQAIRKRKLALTSTSAPLSKYKRPSATGQDVLKCSECSYYAKWPSDLRRHRQVHTMVKRFKCSLCTNKYKYVGDLNVHMRRDHLTEPQHAFAEDVVSSEVVKKCSPAVFRCPSCPFSTHTKADLEQHSRQHGTIDKTFQCRLCEYQTYWRGDVGRHLFRHHNIHLSKEGTELEEHFIVRPDIRPLTKMPSSHLSHTPSGEVELSESNLDSISAIPGLDRLSLTGGLASRKISPNPTGKEGQFACTYPNCEYRATTGDRLDSHMAYHENLKQYMCPTCGKRTNWKWDVVKHMVKVHNDLNATVDDVVALSIEEARDTIADYLSSVERKPVEILTYSCSLCEFKSVDRSKVFQHLNEKHLHEDGHVLSFSTFSQGVTKKTIAAEGGGMPEDKFVEPAAEELAKYEKPFACAICKKSETTQADVKKHYSYAHPYKEVRITYTVDGTEFNYNTLEIYHRKSSQCLESENSGNIQGNQTSPHSPKMIRQDSKYSNPKMHGYIKPFKCSVCGLRSNWKWDVKKHLRAKHPGEGGFVIMLSLEEAQMTYGKECSRSHPKCENQSYFGDTMEPSVPDTKPVPQHSPQLGDMPSGNDYIVVNGKNKPHSLGTQYDPSRRQWKCSGCDYITNWRRNMARHMGRHHPTEKGKMRVIALHLLTREEQEEILEKRREEMEKQGKLVDPDDEEEIGDEMEDNELSFVEESTNGLGTAGNDSSRSSKPDERLWRCPKCPFQSTFRTHIIVHMQKHEMRPFLCALCNSPFMNRGPLHRHLQKVHERADYIKQVKVNIIYDYDANMESSGANHLLMCSLCEMAFSDRSTAAEHVKDVHGMEGQDNYIVPATQKMNTTSKVSVGANGRVRNRKLYHCRLCPYQSQKKTMLNFHMTYHKPTATNRFKCKFCPYYVSTTRLLLQHQRKWHCDGRRIDAPAAWENQQQTQASPPHLSIQGDGYAADVPGTPRRHRCEKCPYTTNSKNDFYYHKQFHRPKRTAEFKCEFCDYWVVHKRLLKQHMRLHTDQTNGLQDVSPAKSVYSDPGLVYDPGELTDLAALKQKMISAKILPSLSKSPKVSPMKLASSCSVDDKPGYVLKNGLYRKLHKCPKCPYTNTRARNMQLHVMMHGPRESPYPLMKCPYCDYHVGSKGLLSHHMKVHQKNYGDTPEKDARNMASHEDEDGNESDDVVDIQAQQKVDTLLQISRMKRFGCEKCPYASAKRQHFERHLELHGSRQRYTCQYCDYSVPSSYLLTQHSRLHLMPNQNLLSSQSINNLQHLAEVPADVALASALPPSDSDMSVTISVIHDHLGLYENSIYDPEQRKLYRCDRCPYANVRRDYLLSHLKFHMVSSSYVCPYCDYSAPKQPLLTQHIRVHFCPLPELSDWLLENGQTERETNQRNIDLGEALKIAREYQNQSKKSKGKEDNDKKDTEGKENMEDGGSGSSSSFVCQYCDREFSSSEKLVKHELQHLIGNQFEMALKVLKEEKAKGGAQREARNKREEARSSRTINLRIQGTEVLVKPEGLEQTKEKTDEKDKGTQEQKKEKTDEKDQGTQEQKKEKTDEKDKGTQDRKGELDTGDAKMDEKDKKTTEGDENIDGKEGKKVQEDKNLDEGAQKEEEKEKVKDDKEGLESEAVEEEKKSGKETFKDEHVDDAEKKDSSSVEAVVTEETKEEEEKEKEVKLEEVKDEEGTSNMGEKNSDDKPIKVMEEEASAMVEGKSEESTLEEKMETESSTAEGEGGLVAGSGNEHEGESVDSEEVEGGESSKLSDSGIKEAVEKSSVDKDKFVECETSVATKEECQDGDLKADVSIDEAEALKLLEDDEDEGENVHTSDKMETDESLLDAGESAAEKTKADGEDEEL